MKYRLVLLGACLLISSPSFGEELGPQQSMKFVAEKQFSYTCFNGFSGEGHILTDGSVAGNFVVPNDGRKFFAALPSGTLKVEEGAVCAHIAGLFFQPCFKVNKIDAKSFRGSIAGFDFAYCVFRQVETRTELKSDTRRTESEGARPTAMKSLNASALY